MKAIKIEKCPFAAAKKCLKQELVLTAVYI